MTHDELLAKISKDSTVFRDELETESLWQRFANISNALRAVVELHKPTGIHSYESYCLQCMKNNGDGVIINIGYPCPTIQAIERELR